MILFRKLRIRLNTTRLYKSVDGIHAILEKESLNDIKTIENATKEYNYNDSTIEKVSIFIFIKFSIVDILTLYKIFLNSKKEKNIIARTIAIHLFEFIDDVGKIIGNSFGEYCTFFDTNTDLKKSLKKLRLSYNTIKQRSDEMKIIRNYVSAHKDRNTYKQLEIINRINLDDFHNIVFEIAEFATILKEFEDEITKDSAELLRSKDFIRIGDFLSRWGSLSQLNE